MSVTRTTVVLFGIGGYMGGFYVAKLLQLGIARSEIFGVESDNDRREAVEKQYGIRCVQSAYDIERAEMPEVGIIASPSPTHRSIISDCARLGIKKLLVEKPIVETVAELSGIDPTLEIYVGYLINFATTLHALSVYMKKHDLVCVSAMSVWGKNWTAVDRPMGSDVVEELPHALATVLCVLGYEAGMQSVRRTSLQLSYIPYVRPELAARAKTDNFNFDELNDTTLASYVVHIDGRAVPVSILSSFNMFDQQRRIELVLRRCGETFQSHKVCLRFDVLGEGKAYDDLVVIDARTNGIAYQMMNTTDKLLEQLKAALSAFNGDTYDDRLVNRELAGEILGLVS